MSRKNAVVISAADLKAWGRMPLYEECAERGQHVPIEDLAATDKVAFISHRWQDAANNLADDTACSQYQVIMAYLLGSEEGQSAAYVWLDLACINQDRGTPDRPNPEGLKQFLVKLDNIGTAIACSHTFLVVPRLIEQQQVDGQALYYSDLKEYTERGWCLFEVLSAIVMRSRIRVALVCGAPAEARFELMQPGPAPGEELTLSKLAEEGNAQRQSTGDDGNRASSNSLRAAVGRALEALRGPGAAPAAAAGALLDRAAECWAGAEDPAALLRKMHEALDADLGDELNNTSNTAGALKAQAAGTQEAPEEEAGLEHVQVQAAGRTQEAPEEEAGLENVQAQAAGTQLAPEAEAGLENVQVQSVGTQEAPEAEAGLENVQAQAAGPQAAAVKDNAPRRTGLRPVGCVSCPDCNRIHNPLNPCEPTRTRGKIPQQRKRRQHLPPRKLKTEQQQRTAATLTVDLNPQDDNKPQAGKAIAALLPRFTKEEDREVVVRLLACLLVLARTAFAAVARRDPEALRALVAEGPVVVRQGLHVDHPDGPTLILQALLPCEMAPLLEALVAELARREAAGTSIIWGRPLGLAGRPLRLDLGANPVNPQGVKALREAAPRLPPVSYLGLQRCGLGVGGALELAKLLAPSPEGGGASTTFGAHLEGLCLGWNSLGEAGGRAVAGALASVPKLEELDLRDNNLGEAGGRAVAGALASVPKLKQMNLRGNNLGEAGGRAVAGALTFVPKLEELDLCGNNLGEVGGQAVAGALASVPKLERLSLEANNLGEGGGRAVAGALAPVPKLHGLSLRDNGLGEEAEAAVRAAWVAPLPDGRTRPKRGLELEGLHGRTPAAPV